MNKVLKVFLYLPDNSLNLPDYEKTIVIPNKYPRRRTSSISITTRVAEVNFLAFLNLQEHAQNYVNISIHSWDRGDFRVLDLSPYLTTLTPIFFNQLLITVDSEIQQSDWPRAFWLISLEPDFSQICDLCRNIANNRNFTYWPNLGEINGQYLQ